MKRIVAAAFVVGAIAIVIGPPSSEAADSIGWGIAAPIDVDPINAYDVSVAASPAGVAFAAWLQVGASGSDVWAARFVPGSGWGTATVIETGTRGAGNLQVAADRLGNAVVVWEQFDGTRVNIYANRFDAAVGWGQAQLVESDNTGPAYFPSVAADAVGNFVAVWQQSDGTRFNAWANWYLLGTGWVIPVLLETNSAGDADPPRVASDRAGNAIAVWSQSDGTRRNVWANRFVVGTGWGIASLLESDNAGPALLPQIDSDDAGNAIAAWEQSNGTVSNIWANRYVAGTGWQGAVLLEGDDRGNAYAPRVALDAVGSGLAVWSQSDGTRLNAWASRFDPAGDWGAPVVIDSIDTSPGWLDVAMDARGNGVAVWAQTASIWANRWSAARGWEGAELLETESWNAVIPRIGMDGFGNAHAVWYQAGYQGDPGRNRIWANRYQADVFPPALTLDAPTASLTNAASVTVSGTTEAGAQVLVNGAPVTVSPSGVFTTSVSLSEGPNAIVAEATDAEGNTATVTKAITRDSTPPAVALASPSDGATTGLPTISVAGSTEPGARLVVNGLLVAVATDGSFAVVVALLDGANTITATATDLAGNAGSASVSVTYASPLPGLQQQLEDTQTELAQTRDALNQTNQELQDTRGSLDDANARLAFLGVELLVALIVVVAVLVAVQLLLYRRLRAAPSPPPPSPPPP